jgi:competence protein ComEA
MVLIVGVIALLCILIWLIWPHGGAEGFEIQPATARTDEAAAAHVPEGAEGGAAAGVTSDESKKGGEEEGARAEQASTVTVYVSGAVARAGVYELPIGARIDDGVTAAGGLNEEAADGFVNLAAPLQDGQQIHIPTREELLAGAPQPAAAGTEASQGRSQSGIGAAAQLVDINRADPATLETLPGIGPATAQRIIAYREAHGPFSAIEELKQVSGIGEKKYAALLEFICV